MGLSCGNPTAFAGLKPGDRVAIYLPMIPEAAFAMLACARIGAIMVPVNPDFGASEAGYVLQHAQVAGVVCSPEALATVKAACAPISAPRSRQVRAPAAGAGRRA